MRSRRLPLITALLGALALLAAGCVTPAIDIDPASSAVGANGFSSTHVFPGDYKLEGDFSRVLESGVLDLLPQEVHVLASEHDGARIEIGVLRPDVPEGEKVPVIAFASPYLLPLDNLDFGTRLARLVENFVPHGYAVALVPVRGTANMGSCMDLMGNAERADLDQAITWLGTQEWSSGNVGMVGVSYDGSTPWEVAGTGNPHLKTIVPISGVNDLHHLMFRNGTPEFRGPLVLNALYYQYGFAQYNPLNGRDAEHVVAGVVCPESIKGFGASVHSAITGERDALGFWAERNSRPLVEANYRGSIFHVQGLQDWNVDPGHNIPWVKQLEDEQGLVVKHLYGQWAHAWPDSNAERSAHARWDWAEMLLRWFDRELKGLDVDVGPRVQVEDSSGRWRSEEAWPPADAQPVTFSFGSGVLSTEATSESSGLLVPSPPDVSFVCDAMTETVGACRAYRSEPFDRDFRIAGWPLLEATVVPTGPGGHLAATLYVQDGGSIQRIGWGQVDLRYAQGGETATLVTPGQPMRVHIEIEPLDAVVPAGSNLFLALDQASYGDHIWAPPTYPVQVQDGGERGRLTVLTFERNDDAFFQAPGK